MIEIFDLSRKKDTSFDEYSFLKNKTEEERKKYFETLESFGVISPAEDNIFVEFGQAASQSFIGTLHGTGATLNELGLGSGMQDYFSGVLQRNQQWNAPDNQSAGTYISRAVGGGLGSSAGSLAASYIGSAIGTAVSGNPKVGLVVGTAAGISAAFTQTFGETVQRNRAAGYSEDKAYGMAFLESGIIAAIENLPFGIVGKGGKAAANMTRIGKITAAGKKELLNKIGQRIVQQVGPKTARDFFFDWGKKTVFSGLGEAGEEGLQYMTSYVMQKIGNDPDAKFSQKELIDSMAQGFIGGFGIGGVTNTPGLVRNFRMRKPNAAPTNTENTVNAPIGPVMGNTIETPVGSAVDGGQVNPLMDEVIRGVGEEFGVKVDYIDNYRGSKKLESADGYFDKETNTIYLDRQDMEADPGISLGHEFKHYLDKTAPELVQHFDQIWQQGQTAEGKVFFAQLAKEWDLDENIKQKEFSAEVFGRIFVRPGTTTAYIQSLESQSRGMGERFAEALRKFIQAVKKRLAGIVKADPEMETLFNNVSELEAEVGKILAEVRRRNGSSSQVENVVGVKGNTEVETVPVSAINVDAQRFQFKSNTSKTSGVDESNKLGGGWDVRAAGNIYLWQDKNGKLYVVNGHHRLELAQRLGVENVNAIIDRESDGVTAEQARRNGVLINIIDEKGSVRDYASFVRSEKLSAEEADARGVTSREKGRAGFLLGKASDTLYEAYINEYIPESKAVIIAEVAQGNEAIEYAGIKLATDRKLAGETLRLTLKLAAQNTSGTKTNTEQGSLFDMVDDSVLQEWEAIGKLAIKHIEELKEEIKSRKSAVKNPEAARKGDVKVGKKAEKLLAQAQQELARWENYATDAELMAQLREEAGITPQEVVAKTESTTATTEQNSEVEEVIQEPTVSKAEQVEQVGEQVDEQVAPEVASAENAQTTETAVVKENLTTETVDTDENGEVRNGTEKDKDVNAFLKRFEPQIQAIVAKNMIEARGDLFDDDLAQVARIAAAKAYEKYDPAKGASLDTYASTAAENAIIDFNRKQLKDFEKSGGSISLDQTNEKGESLHEVVAAGNQARESDAISARKNPQEANRRITESTKLSPLQKKIVDLFNQNLSPSEVIRKLGKRFGAEGHEYMSKEEFQHQIVAIRTIADEEGIVYRKKQERSGGKVEDVNYRKKRLHRQVIPVIQDGKVKDEYAYLLANKKYTLTTIKELQDKALDWILRQGGIVQAAQKILKNQAPSDTAVAEFARTFIINSDVFANDVLLEERIKLNTLEINERSRAGLTLRSMRLDSLNLKDVAAVQALLNKLHKDMPPAEVRKLRDQIKKKHDIDIYKLDQSVVDDKSKLDAVLREHLAKKASFGDKIYEYWINGILSGPRTHFANLLGNTANAVYELGLKRFTEALVNTVARRKDGATFGEFKEMIRAWNWGNARKALKQAFDLEVLDPSGKFLENNMVAIGGKLGRMIRTPGRSLKAADAFAKALIQPMETAAYAYRQGVQAGFTGTELSEYIQKQLSDPDSQSYQWAKERSKELTFQEDVGGFIRRFMVLKESDGAMGTILKLFFPFVKTPYNILKQGVRKSIYGGLNLLWETGKLALGKREFDAQYVSRVAEQLIAWGAFMALYGLTDDDDDLPIITGSSAQYGSAEYGFKANKIPPYSIRIGKNWFSYQGIEPLATGLAAMADTLQAFRDARNGKDGTAVINDLWRGTKQVVLEKSYMDSLEEIVKATEEPENFVRALSNPARGFIPNLYTQVRHAFEENVQDNKSREIGYEWLKDQFFTVTNRAGVTAALPKIDYFGREVKKDDWSDTWLSDIGRLMPVKYVDAENNMDPAEALIWRYNQKNPNESWYPSVPQPTFSRNGQKYYFAGEAYQEYAIDAGKLAHRQILNAISAGRLNVNNPTAEDIKLIKDIFSRARKETIDKHIRNAKKAR